MEKNKYKCWWCIYKCNNRYFHIPIEYKNKTFHVIGYMCSLNCCIAYIFNSNHIRNSSLSLNLLYKLYSNYIESENITCITPSLPKEVLIDFGGELTYDAYNKKKLLNNRSHILIPPVTRIDIQLETSTLINIKDNQNNNNILNHDDILKKNKKLKLKRSKPLTYNHLSIEKSLGIFKSG